MQAFKGLLNATVVGESHSQGDRVRVVRLPVSAEVQQQNFTSPGSPFQSRSLPDFQFQHHDCHVRRASTFGMQQNWPKTSWMPSSFWRCKSFVYGVYCMHPVKMRLCTLSMATWAACEVTVQLPFLFLTLSALAWGVVSAFRDARKMIFWSVVVSVTFCALSTACSVQVCGGPGQCCLELFWQTLWSLQYRPSKPCKVEDFLRCFPEIQ